MLKFLKSPLLVIAFFLGGFSTFLAYKGEYEAAMAGAGVAVATATARTSRDEDSEDSYELTQTQARWYRGQYEELKNEMRERDRSLRWEKEKLMQLIERAENVRRYERNIMSEIAELKRELTVLSQHFEQQDKIKEMELEIERLEADKELLSEQQGCRSLPESKLEFFVAEVPEMHIAEESGDCEDYL